MKLQDETQRGLLSCILLQSLSYMAAPDQCVPWWLGTTGENIGRLPCLTLNGGPPRASLPVQAAASQHRTELWDRQTCRHADVKETDKHDAYEQMREQQSPDRPLHRKVTLRDSALNKTFSMKKKWLELEILTKSSALTQKKHHNF